MWLRKSISEIRGILGEAKYTITDRYGDIKTQVSSDVGFLSFNDWKTILVIEPYVYKLASCKHKLK